MQQTFKVPEVSCAHCKSSIENALKPLDGVHEATVDIDNKIVTVDFDDERLDRSRLVREIEDVGYPVAG
jgi:copper chaperone